MSYASPKVEQLTKDYNNSLAAIDKTTQYTQEYYEACRKADDVFWALKMAQNEFLTNCG